MGVENPNDPLNRPITPPPSPDSLVPRGADLLHKHEAEHVYGVKTFHVEPQLAKDKKQDVTWDPRTYATEYQVSKAVEDQLQNVKSKQDKLTAGRLISLTDEDGDAFGNTEHISVEHALTGYIDKNYDEEDDHLGDKGANLYLSSRAEFDRYDQTAPIVNPNADEVNNINDAVHNLTDQLARIQEQLAALNGNQVG